jgi:hypothetical protein
VKDFDLIQKLVGNVTQAQLRYVDCAVTADLGVFMPFRLAIPILPIFLLSPLIGIAGLK